MHEKITNSFIPYGKINPFHGCDPQRRIGESRAACKFTLAVLFQFWYISP
jgi:hypothetical protein